MITLTVILSNIIITYKINKFRVVDYNSSYYVVYDAEGTMERNGVVTNIKVNILKTPINNTIYELVKP